VDFCPLKVTRAVTLDGSGKRTVDLTSAQDLRGHDLVQVRHTMAQGDLIRAAETVPLLFLRKGSPTLDGVLVHRTTGTYQLRTSTGAIRGTASLDGGPDQLGTFEKNGSPVSLRVGNKVTGSIPANLSITIPKGPTVMKASTDVLAGTCYPKGKVLIEQLTGDDIVLTAKADGTWSKDFTALGGFASGASAQVACVTKGYDIVDFDITAP
jgi:hypothetical protein